MFKIYVKIFRIRMLPDNENYEKKLTIHNQTFVIERRKSCFSNPDFDPHFRFQFFKYVKFVPFRMLPEAKKYVKNISNAHSIICARMA